MRKSQIVFFVIFSLLFFSCAKIEKNICEKQFLSIVNSSEKKVSIKRVNGSIYAKGIIFLFRASVDKNIKIDLFTPFGNKVAEFLQDNEKICLYIKNNSICGKSTDVYKEILNEYVPFDLTNLITGQFKISKNSQFTCKDNQIDIKDKGVIYTYKHGVLQKVFYNGFSVVYQYENEKPKRVVLKSNGDTLIKIFVRDIE
ncbi:MAG: hypothetical protein D6831_04240 [Aquificota bacterium]|nr:MAG: hypothetical protein D6831_04240 [Aquificota bacterium]